MTKTVWDTEPAIHRPDDDRADARARYRQVVADPQSVDANELARLLRELDIRPAIFEEHCRLQASVVRLRELVAAGAAADVENRAVAKRLAIQAARDRTTSRRGVRTATEQQFARASQAVRQQREREREIQRLLRTQWFLT